MLIPLEKHQTCSYICPVGDGYLSIVAVVYQAKSPRFYFLPANAFLPLGAEGLGGKKKVCKYLAPSWDES